MSKIKFKDIKFNDMFNLKRGQVISKEYIHKNPGKYPVYSTQIDNAFGYIDNYMYDGKYLIWNTDGLAGYVRLINGKFSITNIVGILTFKESFDGSKINLEYIKDIIEPIFRESVKGRIGKNGKNEYTKLNSTMLKRLDIVIPIPIKDSGEYDLEAQENIASKYRKINIQKNILIEKKKKIEEMEIEFLEGLNTREVKITDLFTPVLGNGKYTKKFCMNNTGEYPVYSGNTIGSFSNINEYTYDGEYLTWAKDGLAGYIMYHNEKFSITNHRGILMPTELCDNIDLEYIKIVLEPVFRSKIKGRLGLEGKNEYTTLSKDMIVKIEDNILIPIRSDGKFDLEKQKEIAQKYNIVKNIKNSISMKIAEIIDKEIVF